MYAQVEEAADGASTSGEAAVVPMGDSLLARAKAVAASREVDDEFAVRAMPR